MTNPEEKLKEFLQKMLNGFELLQKLDEANEADEIQHLKEEMEKSLKAMRNDINNAKDFIPEKRKNDEVEFYQQTVEMFGKEQADELWKMSKWDAIVVLRNLALALMQEPEYKKKIEDRGVNIEDIIKLTSVNLLPNAENAVVDISKLRGYCLNPEHPSGKDKARLFS